MDDEHIPIAPIEQDTTPSAIAPPAEGWAKTVHESRSHYFVNGRALCRLFYLEEGRSLGAAPIGEVCGCCQRAAPPVLARSGGNGGPRPTLATVVTGSGDSAPEAVAAHDLNGGM